jgi:glycerophosphoryl diester phosphodiesterase
VNRKSINTLTVAAALLVIAPALATADDHDDDSGRNYDNGKNNSVQLGPRPFYLVEGMDEGKLKDRLMQCKDGPFYRTDFSIGHRGSDSRRLDL